MFNVLIPRGVKRMIASKMENLFVAMRGEIEAEIPKVPLHQKHINNLKVILYRDLMLESFPKNAVVAEIGVHKGQYSQFIYKITSPAKLHFIDLWSNGAPDKAQQEVEDKFKNEIDSGRVELHIGYSTEWIPKFADHYFDWVYLDTDHSYSLTAKELALLQHKIKPGGILAGHDYTVGNWVSGTRYGVIEAVHEFCVNENWEIIYLTIETHSFRSFALRKI